MFLAGGLFVGYFYGNPDGGLPEVCMVFVNSPHYSNEDHVELDFPISLFRPSRLEISMLCCALAYYNWGAMYEHLRMVPPGKRLRVPPRTRPEILGSG